ncbi:MAG: hypothetical protein KAG53_01280 [Endozoicomonadaceae bacterium]|nr:hypothetical protein [Endozoicomonadaceae bacterium]
MEMSSVIKCIADQNRSSQTEEVGDEVGVASSRMLKKLTLHSSCLKKHSKGDHDKLKECFWKCIESRDIYKLKYYLENEPCMSLMVNVVRVSSYNKKCTNEENEITIIKNQSIESALLSVIENFQSDIAMILIEYGVDTNICNERRIIDWHDDVNDKINVDLCDAHEIVNVGKETKVILRSSPLSCAILTNQVEIVEKIIDIPETNLQIENFDDFTGMEKKCDGHATPMMNAVIQMNADIVKRLIVCQHKKDRGILQKMLNGNTLVSPLKFLIKNSFYETCDVMLIASYLLRYGADINASITNETSILLLSICKNWPSMCKLLYRIGADTKDRCFFSFTRGRELEPTVSRNENALLATNNNVILPLTILAIDAVKMGRSSRVAAICESVVAGSGNIFEGVMSRYRNNYLDEYIGKLQKIKKQCEDEICVMANY